MAISRYSVLTSHPITCLLFRTPDTATLPEPIKGSKIKSYVSLEAFIILSKTAIGNCAG